MSEFKGTKGEWGVFGDAYCISIENEIGMSVCAINSYMSKDEYRANAKLIACAPEMLEILDKIITGYENAGGEMWIPDRIQEHIFTAKKIIKKATE